MRVAICDDIPAEGAAVSALLELYEAGHPSVPLSVSVFTRGEDLLEATERVMGFDLYFLDIILMGQEDGITVARRLREMGMRGRIVFLTASPDYALPAFSVKAAGYLLKPVEPEPLFSAMNDAAEEYMLHRGEPRKLYTFRTPTGVQTVAVDDIIYVEVTGHTPHYHMIDGVIRGSEMRISFEEGMSELIQSGHFLRPHRSYLVNAAYISAVGPTNLSLFNGTSIPVARLRATELRTAYLEYLAANTEPEGH